MDKKNYDLENLDIAWCPGCGDFAILNIIKQVLVELGISPEKLVVVSGIGQAAKTAHYFKCNLFNGLHGRALPPAVAIKAVNPELTVIADSGDGCTYGEGGNHFLHTIRRNPDITNVVHNNMVYGLTKGQASPTSAKGFKSSVQIDGVNAEPFNPIAVAIALNAAFVARAFCGHLQQTKEILKKAIQHKGYALVDILQPCPTFNKVNTYQWFKDHTYYLETTYNPEDRNEAFKRATETDKLPLGIFYLNKNKLTFEETLSVYQTDKTPLPQRISERKEKLAKMMNSTL